MTRLQKIEEYVTELLTNEIPEVYYFHNLMHTQHVVMSTAYIGEKEGLTDKELELVQVAAWFHDTGFTRMRTGHEEESVKIAEAYLRKHRFEEEDIEVIAACIRATKIPQSPKTLLEKILCDSDLTHIASSIYWERSNNLLKEIESCEQIEIAEIDWLKSNLKFLENHHFFTDFGKARLEVLQLSAIRENRELIDKLLTDV
ncbi:MAG: hypothetical protein CMO34_04090 [Verrucomicrobia bacterium]|nr:hypothetical protein [Verrucomicrobiota bacterium]